jgi:hypothetical protein
MFQEGMVDEYCAAFLYLRGRCRLDLYWLGTKILGYKGERVDPVFHQWFCDELSVERNTLFLLPRDHTKSTWGIAIKVTQDVLRNPDQAILLASNTSEMSLDRLRNVKANLSNKTLTTLFPEILSPDPEMDVKRKTSFYKNLVWRADNIQVLRTVNRAEPTVMAAGVEKTITGRHVERVYLDDIIDYETVVSEAKTDNALRFFQYLQPMINPASGIIRMYGTRYDDGDLYGWLLDKMNNAHEVSPIDMRVISREVKEDFDTFRQYMYIRPRDFGRRATFDKRTQEKKAFIYSYFNDEMLERIRNAADSEYMFISQYYNRLISDDEKIFPHPYLETAAVPSGLEYYLTVDPAFKVSKRSDFTAIVVCGYGKSDKIYVVEATRLRGDPLLLINKLYEFYDKYHFRVGGMEDGAWHEIMAWAFEYARKELQREKLPLKPLKLKFEANAKDSRIRGLSYFVKTGALVLREGLEDLKREMYRYPGNTRSKDDLLDALSMQRELIAWKRERKREEQQYVRPRETYRMAFDKMSKSKARIAY